MLTTVAEKPHWGCSGTPFMNSTTGYSVTVSEIHLRAGFSVEASVTAGNPEEAWPLTWCARAPRSSETDGVRRSGRSLSGRGDRGRQDDGGDRAVADGPLGEVGRDLGGGPLRTRVGRGDE